MNFRPQFTTKFLQMPSTDGRGIQYAPFLIALILAIVKSAYLGAEKSDEDVVVLGALIFRNDLPFLGLVGFFLAARALLSITALRALCELIVVAAIFWYLVDTSVIVALNSRVPLTDLVAFLKEMKSAPDIIWLAAFSLLTVCLLIYARRFEFVASRPQLYVIGFFVLLCIPNVDPAEGLSRYATPILIDRKNRNVFAWPAPWFSSKEMEELRVKEFNDNTTALLNGEKRNIIIVVVESMTASDSLRTSGIFNLLPKFDKISEDGMLFTNFYANYIATEGGLISLFYGLPPLQFPGSSWTPYDSFVHQDSIIRAYNAHGYKTTLLSTAPLTFRNKATLLTAAGFNSVLGLHEVPEFREVPQFAFHSPTDQVLYKRALKEIESRATQSSPYLLAIETTSSHLPYVNPLGPPHTEKQVWKYVDDQLFNFYELLLKNNFFDQGVLIITGDHRKFIPINRKEQQLYGDSAESRIPLALIGAGIPKNVVDRRLFQQIDLLKMLPRIAELSTPLSSYTTLVTAYHMPFIGSNNQSTIIFTEQSISPNAYYMESHGRDNEWIFSPPEPLAGQIVQDRRRLVARLQYCNSNPGSCSNK